MTAGEWKSGGESEFKIHSRPGPILLLEVLFRRQFDKSGTGFPRIRVRESPSKERRTRGKEKERMKERGNVWPRQVVILSTLLGSPLLTINYYNFFPPISFYAPFSIRHLPTLHSPPASSSR